MFFPYLVPYTHLYLYNTIQLILDIDRNTENSSLKKQNIACGYKLTKQVPYFIIIMLSTFIMNVCAILTSLNLFLVIIFIFLFLNLHKHLFANANLIYSNTHLACQSDNNTLVLITLFFSLKKVVINYNCMLTSRSLPIANNTYVVLHFFIIQTNIKYGQR